MPKPPSHNRQIKSNVTGREYRVWLRFPSRRVASCQFADSDDESSWPVHVHDISRTGFKLLSARKFEQGTVLKIGDTDEGASETSLVLARVVQLTPSADNKWTVSCAFLKELSEDKLLAWLKEQA